MSPRQALVVTVSDGVHAGTRDDASGEAVARLMTEAGFRVSRQVVPDEQREIVSVIQDAANTVDIILTTGGTGFGPRDVTPEATAMILERRAPGLVHVMMSKGLESTPRAALSRALAGTVGRTLVVNLPGSPKGAVEGIGAIMDLIPHALELISGHTEHKSA